MNELSNDSEFPAGSPQEIATRLLNISMEDAGISVPFAATMHNDLSDESPLIEGAAIVIGRDLKNQALLSTIKETIHAYTETAPTPTDATRAKTAKEIKVLEDKLKIDIASFAQYWLEKQDYHAPTGNDSLPQGTQEIIQFYAQVAEKMRSITSELAQALGVNLENKAITPARPPRTMGL